MRKIITATFIFIAAGLISCGESETQTKRTYSDQWQQFVSNEIDSLSLHKPKFDKTIFVDGECKETFKSDTVDWAQEMEVFLSIDVSKELSKHEYFKSENAQNKIGGMVYTEYTCKDTNAFLQVFTVVKNAGKINLIQWQTRERSFMIDRDRTMGYVPMKGIQIKVRENSLWSKPTTIEISGNIQTPQSLEQ